MAAGLSLGSLTMHVQYGKHVTGISGSAACMAATLAHAAAHAPRMHRHVIVATDSAHHLAAEDCEWRPMHGGHELLRLANRQRDQKLPSVFERGGQAVLKRGGVQGGWRGLQAVKRILPHDVSKAREVFRGAAMSQNASGVKLKLL